MGFPEMVQAIGTESGFIGRKMFSVQFENSWYGVGVLVWFGT